MFPGLRLSISCYLNITLCTGLVVPWRWLAVAGEVPAVVMVVLLVFMPRSPRRLLSLGQQEQAEKALRWLRGKHYDTHVELHAIQVDEHKCCDAFKITLGLQWYMCWTQTLCVSTYSTVSTHRLESHVHSWRRPSSTDQSSSQW